jgi:hypothetical protein
MAGNYTLTAVANDSAGNNATSAPVNICVFPDPPTTPLVAIYAPDPVAVEGTNGFCCCLPPTAVTNYVCGTNTATFLVLRDSATNTDLTVTYAIGGTAINGVDYQTIPGSVVIPAGQRYARIVIYPLNDTDSEFRPYDTVVLGLMAPTNLPAAYRVGSPAKAGAVILEENCLPLPQPLIRCLTDNSQHISLPATNGMNYCLQISSDMIHWQPLCTNTVLKGSAQFVNPDGITGAGMYYRIVPVDAPASY